MVSLFYFFICLNFIILLFMYVVFYVFTYIYFFGFVLYIYIYIFLMYRIAGNIGGELNLADWRFASRLPN